MADNDSGIEPTDTNAPDDDFDAELSDDSQFDDSDYQAELVDDSYNRSEYAVEPEDFSYDEKLNDEGEKIEGAPVVEDEGFLNEKGNIDWEKSAVDADKDGFDTKEKIEAVTLQPGETFIRYGSGRGHFGAPEGSKYDTLSLPYKQSSLEYHEYRVVAPIECRRGTVAANFGRSGGGTQYCFTDSISTMKSRGMITEVYNDKR